VNYHSWWVAEEKDAVYNIGNTALGRIATGAADRHIDQEIDVQVSRALTPQLHAAAGYAHIVPGGFLKEATPGASYSHPYKMDGFCVGEPWNNRAIEDGIGFTAITTQQMWKDPARRTVLAARFADAIRAAGPAFACLAVVRQDRGMVTHDIDEALYLADRLILTTDGPEATVGEILRVPFPRPRVRSSVLGHPEYQACRRRVIDFLDHHAHQSRASALDTVLHGNVEAG
jgi:hypothetical protein